MAISFPGSKINFDPIRFNTPSSNAAAYGSAVDYGKIWRNNRNNSFSASDFIAQDIANKSAVSSAASRTDASAMANSLSAIGMVSAAEKEAERLKAAAKKAARKSMFGSVLGAVAGIGGTLLSGGNPLVGMAAAQGGQALGSAIG